MRAPDCADTFLFLHLFDGLMKFFHVRPMHVGPEMVLGMVAVVEKQPIIDSSVAAYPPGDRLIGICTMMPIVAVEITEAVTQIAEGEAMRKCDAPVKQEQYNRR